MPEGSRPLSDPLVVGTAVDPVAAVLRAHETGRSILLRTSGSAGSPRSVVRGTESWFTSFRHVAELTGLRSGARMWLPGPLGSTMNLFAAVLAQHVGARLVDEPRHATHTHLTPHALRGALDDGLDLSGVQVTVAGERLTAALRDRAEDRGARISHYYGAAELSFVAWGSDEGDLRAFPGVELALREGEIWARSPYLCERYDGPPGPLRRTPDGFATVGDRGALVGDVLQVAGRGEVAVTTGGATVLVDDVEEALRTVVRGSVVVLALPHGVLGQVVAAVLTDAEEIDGARAAARARLAPAQRPRQWFHLPSLPTTPAGKVDRLAVYATVTGPDAVRLVGSAAGRRREATPP